eukprot:1426461-Pyramimonas_sp.AAC.1
MGGWDACERNRWGRGCHSLWATKRARVVPKWAAQTHANGTVGALGAAPNGATNRARGAPK